MQKVKNLSAKQKLFFTGKKKHVTVSEDTFATLVLILLSLGVIVSIMLVLFMPHKVNYL
jgi:hypothetical protein